MGEVRRSYTELSQINFWQSGQAYTMRVSATNEMNPPGVRPEQDGQIDAPHSSIVAIFTSRPVRGSGREAGACDPRWS